MLVGEWSRMGLVEPNDVLPIPKDADGNPEIEEIKSTEELEKLWSVVVKNLACTL